MTFSIIIPVYNVVPYLRECLSSVVKAAEKLNGFKVEERSVEIVCVDDGSTDGSGAILDEYASRFNSSTLKPCNFKVIHQPNRGVSVARNAALDVATGEWVLFVDADDVISPRTLEGCRQAIETVADVELVHFHQTQFPQDGHPAGLAEPLPSKVSAVDMTKRLDPVIVDSCCYQFAYRRDCLNGIRFEVGRRIGEDLVFIADFLKRCNRVVETGAVFYGYRLRMGSAFHSQKSELALREGISSLVLRFERLLADPRAVDRACVKRRAIGITEFFARDFFSLPRQERTGLLAAWCQEVERLEAFAFRIPCWSRWVMWLLCRVRAPVLLWLLCFLPDFIKRKGFHR